MSWELIHRHLLYPSDSDMKEICRTPNLTGLPKQFTKNLNQAPCKICYTEMMTTLSIGTTVDTNNLQPGELIHMDFSLYNMTSILVFTSIITVVFTNTRMLWILPIAYK